MLCGIFYPTACFSFVGQAESTGDGATVQPVLLKLKISKPTGDMPSSMDLRLPLCKVASLTFATRMFVQVMSASQKRRRSMTSSSNSRSAWLLACLCFMAHAC